MMGKANDIMLYDMFYNMNKEVRNDNAIEQKKQIHLPLFASFRPDAVEVAAASDANVVLNVCA